MINPVLYMKETNFLAYKADKLKSEAVQRAFIEKAVDTMQMKIDKIEVKEEGNTLRFFYVYISEIGTLDKIGSGIKETAKEANKTFKLFLVVAGIIAIAMIIKNVKGN